MFCLFSFLFFISFCFSQGCFLRFQELEIQNDLNSERYNVDIPIELNTMDLIGSGYISSCSDIRFMNDSAYLDFYVESPCNAVDSLFWVTVDYLDALGTETLYVLYDCNTTQEAIPSEGEAISFSGSFFSFTNESSCSGNWVEKSDWDDRFIKISNTYNGIVNGSFGDHTHTFSGSLGTNSAPSSNDCNSGSETRKLIGAHDHTFDVNGLTTKCSDIAPYYTLRLCESPSSFDLMKGLIFPFNGSFSDDLSEFSDLYGRYPRIMNDVNSIGDIGGNSNHTHHLEWYGNVSTDGTFLCDAATVDSFSYHDHSHYFDDYLDVLSSEFDHFVSPFGYLSGVSSSLGSDVYGGMMMLVTAAPPKGWTQVNADGYYLKGGSSFSLESDSTASGEHPFDETYLSIGNSIIQTELSLFGGSEYSLVSHSHALTLTQTINCPDGDCEYSRVEIPLFRRQTPSVSVSLGVEQFECFGILNTNETVCSGNGNCTNPNECTCDDLHDGYDCFEFSFTCNSLANFDDEVCSGHGTCESYNNCSCAEGYSGEWCEFWTCDDLAHNATDVCHGFGDCVGFDECSCVNSSFIPELFCSHMCFGILMNETDVCDGHGNCTLPDTCECEQDWSTSLVSNCSIPICFNEEGDEGCSNHGVCEEPNSCSCFNGWDDEKILVSNCSIPECFGSFGREGCSLLGDCILPDTCDCDEHWIGTYCNVTQCFGVLSNDSSVCGNRGECVGFDECMCNEHWYGEGCNVTMCGSFYSNDTANVCTNKGSCVDYDECDCDEGYYGDECEITTCFGEWSNVSSSCGGIGGQCFPMDVCSCREHYYGASCNVTLCNDIFSNDTTNPDLCHGKGECVLYNSCECVEDYYGSDCETTTCNGVLSNASSIVCNGSGSCWPKDECACSEHYYGEFCGVTICGGVLSNDSSNVCHGRGTCDDFDTCSCISSDYDASGMCKWSCGGSDMDDDGVCSGHGECVNPDECNCDSGILVWEGPNCVLPVVPLGIGGVVVITVPVIVVLVIIIIVLIIIIVIIIASFSVTMKVKEKKKVAKEKREEEIHEEEMDDALSMI